MRVVLTTFGSLGDVNPYVALGLELQRRGHNVVLATTPVFGEHVRGSGLDFHAVRPDFFALGPEGRVVERVIGGLRGTSYLVRGIFMAHLRESYEDTLAACQRADVVVAHPLTFASPVVADRLAIPWVSCALAPASMWSIHDPPRFAFLPWPLSRMSPGPALSAAAIAVAKRVVGGWTAPVHRLRRELGLGAGLRHLLFEGQFSPHLHLALFPPQFGPPQPDWPANTVQCGFPVHDRLGGAGEPEDDLDGFLRDGQPPVAFTLGSSAVMAAGRFYEESAAAAEALGVRALLLVGRGAPNRPARPLPAAIHVRDYAPYSEVLPRCAAVVHSGGVGTTAQVLLSGRPAIVCPYAYDQPDNARRCVRLGVARVIPRAAYRADRVARELGTLLADGAAGARARDVGLAIRNQPGAERAAEAIEALASRW